MKSTEFPIFTGLSAAFVVAAGAVSDFTDQANLTSYALYAATASFFMSFVQAIRNGEQYKNMERSAQISLGLMLLLTGGAYAIERYTTGNAYEGTSNGLVFGALVLLVSYTGNHLTYKFGKNLS